MLPAVSDSLFLFLRACVGSLFLALVVGGLVWNVVARVVDLGRRTVDVQDKLRRSDVFRATIPYRDPATGLVRESVSTSRPFTAAPMPAIAIVRTGRFGWPWVEDLRTPPPRRAPAASPGPRRRRRRASPLRRGGPGANMGRPSTIGSASRTAMPHAPLDLLCIEPRYPGRLGGVADWLVRRRGYRVRFFCHRADPPEFWPEATGRGIEVVAFEVGGVAKEPKVEWTKVLERGLCYAYGGWEVLEGRRPRPIDLILGRSDGLGSTLFAPVTYPGAPVVQFFDGYYDPDRREPGDEAEDQPEAFRHWRRAANAIELVELENGVTPWAPTEYQRGLFPDEYRDDFLVLHDGVETRGLPPRSRGRLVVGDRTIPEGTPVVTFVARSLDHVRGFDRFAAVVERLQRDVPGVVAVAAGNPVVARALDHAHFGRDFAAPVLDRHPAIDRDRLWMPGVLPPAGLRRLLARSDLHVVAGRPHPASRSLVEAMAAGCAVAAMDTEAARELLDDGQSGVLCADQDALNDASADVLRDLDASRPLGDAAAGRVAGRYARDVTLPALVGAFERLVERGRP